MISLKKYSNISQYQSLIALFFLCLALALMTENFMTADNFWNVMRQISVNVCISVGMTLVILTAGIDLSVGSILALCGAITAGFNSGLPWLVFSPAQSGLAYTASCL